MNLNDETQRGRLFKAMEQSYRALDPFRNLVRGLVEEYAGPGYGHNGTRPRFETLMNLMNQAVDAYTMSLVANRPRILVSTKKKSLEAFAQHYQVAVNNLIQEIHLEYTLRQAVLDAFFCVGIAKVHMADSVQVQIEEGVWMDPGTPFVSNVSLDNWVHDMSATSYHKVRFAGDSYRIPFEDLGSDIFDQSVVKKLQPTSKLGVAGDERLEQISRGTETDQDDLEPMIDLADIWIPREGKIFTFALSAPDKFSPKSDVKPLAVMDWDGPEFGPYPILSFNQVPENILPASPAAQLAPLARLINSLLRKQAKRARAHRRVHTYTPAGAKGAQNIQRASDDEFREVDSPEDLKTIEIGGISPQTQAFLVGSIDQFDRVAGNLTAILGLGAQADTASQEQLIHGAVSKTIAQMQARVVEFTRTVINSLGYMLWSDEAKVIPGTMPVAPGIEDYQIDATWRPGDREGDFVDYDLDVDVYSMPYQSPGQRVQAINQLIGTVYAPLAQMLVAQGGQIDMQRLTEIYADLMNIPRLRDVVTFGGGMPMGGQEEEEPGMPASTRREYVRRNIPTGGTAASRSAVQQSQWLNMSGQANPDQVVAASR